MSKDKETYQTPHYCDTVERLKKDKEKFEKHLKKIEKGAKTGKTED